MNTKKLWLLAFFFFLIGSSGWAQKTLIKGFANFDTRYTDEEENASFFLGEQDLFITSQITDRISFLGESVFRYSPSSPTSFDVSIERLILSYNIKGNHTILFGKHHTPFSYWNDTYHHGRVFFPTVDRPLLFRTGLIEIHTTGIAIQGLNLGDQKFGYQLMIGNGIGSNDFADDNKFKSITTNVHLKPKKGMKFGLTSYIDKFSSDASDHHREEIEHNDSLELAPVDIFQVAGGAYFKYFRKKYEFLTEGHLIQNDNDSTGTTLNSSFYAYAGYRITDKIVPYVKYDIVDISKDDLFYGGPDKQMVSLGMRYEFSYLAIMKLEYNYTAREDMDDINGLYFQFAVGF